MSGLLFIGPIIRDIVREGVRAGWRYSATIFEKSYRIGGYPKGTGRAVHKGFVYGTYAGQVGGQLKDAWISSGVDTPPNQQSKTRKHMVFPYSQRKHRADYCYDKRGRKRRNRYRNS